MRTGIIRYNLADRGRAVRGVDRNFDLASAARLINSPDVQERVRHGDLLGYFGHWPRQKFGLNPAEGGVVDGQAVAVAPALRTVSIKASPDGWVEHEAEFLDTVPGKIAARMFASKAGGFSSAIYSGRTIGSKSVPTGFYGFDYVLEPNYSGNRGYALCLDGVMDAELTAYDSVREQHLVLEQCNVLLDSMQGEYDRLLAAFNRLQGENEYYLDRLAREGKPTAILDGVMDVTTRKVGTHLDSADAFLDVPLFAAEQRKVEIKESAWMQRMIRGLK